MKRGKQQLALPRYKDGGGGHVYCLYGGERFRIGFLSNTFGRGQRDSGLITSNTLVQLVLRCGHFWYTLGIRATKIRGRRYFCQGLGMNIFLSGPQLRLV